MQSIIRRAKTASRPARAWLARSIFPSTAIGFEHRRAQRYEFAHNASTIREDFADLYRRCEEERQRGGLWHDSGNQWFDGDDALWKIFADHVRNRACLEIGCGPFGFLAPCHWIKRRSMIDPLIDDYRSLQLEMTGQTFFTSEVTTYASAAEDKITALVGSIDGAIICRNALDHCDDPLAVLHNIGQYAAPGCYLLLWSDIWHLNGADEGHRNITKSLGAMDSILRGYGFHFLKRSAPIRNAGECIEYGVIALKS